MRESWSILQPNLDEVLRAQPHPLAALAAGRVPAIVLRQVLTPAACQTIVRRLLDRGLMYDPTVEKIDDKFVRAAVKEGGWGRIADPSYSMFSADPATKRRRIDIGTSLGNLGNYPDEFFADSARTHELFASLFDGMVNPIDVLYANLQQLAEAEEHRVMTAHEADGRRYGPAIFRIHYGGYTYGPHFDSVRLREKRTGFAVHRFEHQFAGVMCIQNTEVGGETAQCVIHRCLWSPEIDAHLTDNTFHDYAAARNIPRVRVELDPGDLYFFNTRSIHEVPGLAGEQPRIVLATFIGYSENDPEVFVWS